MPPTSPLQITSTGFMGTLTLLTAGTIVTEDRARSQIARAQSLLPLHADV